MKHLIRTLAEARSRASELATSIGARLGAGHPLSDLSNDARLKVEDLLRELQIAAVEPQSATGFANEAPPAAARTSSAAHTATLVSFASSTGLEPDHWLSMFVEDLTAHLKTGAAITFEDAERLLQQRKNTFLKDFLVARRMLRTYPELFSDLRSEALSSRAASHGGQRE